MKCIVRSTFGVAISLVLVVAGCTEPNPNYYVGDGAYGFGDWGGGGADFRYGSDGLSWPDAGGDARSPRVDGIVLPPFCSADTECDDGLWCTEDRCNGSHCVNTRTAGCLIDGQCYSNFKPNPANPCQQCTEQYPNSWEGIGDGVPCPSDGIDCTNDLCYAGVCTHLLDGKSCLVGSACYGEGNVGQCEECIPTLSSTALTPTNGKACATSFDKLAGMCVDTVCKGWVEAHIDPVPGKSTSSTLSSVAFIDGDKTMWAGGAYRETTQGQWGNYDGFFVRLDPLTLVNPTIKIVDAQIVDLHHNLAVDGDKGFYRFENGDWQQLEILKKVQRSRVWGITLNGNQELYYLTGESNDSGAPLYRCEYGVSSKKVACNGLNTNRSGQALGPVWGFLDPSGNGQTSAWMAATGQYDDIYFYNGAGSSGGLSSNAPTGCQDSNGSACSLATNGQDFSGVYGTGPSDLWLVGENGVVLHYNGGSWTSINTGVAEQAYYNLIDVFADAKLVTIVASVAWQGGQTVALFNYDRVLQRWHGPIEVKVALSWQDSTDINAMSGTGYDNLWMVGTDLHWSGAASQRAWALRLE